MTVGLPLADLTHPDLADDMYRLISELYPICRSITGDGFRDSMRIIQKRIPLQLHEVPTGTPAFDWTVPKEWNVRDAYVMNAHGERVIDFRKSNLHLVNYSVPVRRRLSLPELKQHLHSIPDQPDLIPYRTSYYKETWGFCLSHNQLLGLPDEEYDVVIDTTLADGHLTYGELLLPGESEEEVLISAHSCHPSLCNDNLSGVAVSVFLASVLQAARRRYSYRFLYLPGTIGPIVWLSRNEDLTRNIRHGLVVACVGDGGPFTYKKSRRGTAEIDRAVQHVLRHSGHDSRIKDFSPYGYDERQYCSPGFDLPVGSLTRTPHGEFPQYHTSADDLTFVQPRYLMESLAQYLAVVEVLERNRTYVNLNPKCEPQLGRRGLYSMLGGRTDSPTRELAMLWVLNLSDASHSLLDIAERADLAFTTIDQAAGALVAAGLLQENICAS